MQNRNRTVNLGSSFFFFFCAVCFFFSVMGFSVFCSPWQPNPFKTHKRLFLLTQTHVDLLSDLLDQLTMRPLLANN
ncbi:hypothetical protein Hanom_Chr11g01048321 [Helianthus anomalus]